MDRNILKLSADKTEVMLSSSRHNSKSMDTISVNVGNSLIAFTSCVRNLLVMYDSTMTIERQMNAVCWSGNGQLRKISRIRRYLSNEATKSLVNGLATSRLDYCNALLHDLTNNIIDKLQRVQNTAARITTRTSRHSHITPVLKEYIYDALNDHSPTWCTYTDQVELWDFRIRWQ